MSDNVDQHEADFIMVLSSEMISTIVEQYLNRELYKKQVTVVDTKPTESGYAFGVCFAEQVSVVQPVVQHYNAQWVESKLVSKPTDNATPSDSTASLYAGNKRNSKGKFTTHKVKDSM